jgi:hypothetical protein
MLSASHELMSIAGVQGTASHGFLLQLFKLLIPLNPFKSEANHLPTIRVIVSFLPYSRY